MGAYNTLVAAHDQITTVGGGQAQRVLSASLDNSLRCSLKSSHMEDPYWRAHMNLVSLPGAGVWLTAMPEDDTRDWDSSLFQIALKRRVRVRVQSQDAVCPCCGDVMDSYGDHALVCPCRGDRTVRHNAVRDVVHADAFEAKMAPEKEKQWLLPSRPEEDGIHARQAQEGDRRPADVWLPRGSGSTNGRPEALDFAVTSGMRQDMITKAIDTPESIVMEYENFKRTYKDTKSQCDQARLEFTPVVFEAHGGGWSQAAGRICEHISKQQISAGFSCKEGPSMRIAQRISTAIHLANARAIQRRLWQDETELTQAFDLEAADASREDEFP